MGYSFGKGLKEILALIHVQVDAHQPVSDHRKARCTGTALQVAAGLVDTGMATGSCTARLMLFVGGPCTEGVAAHAVLSLLLS